MIVTGDMHSNAALDLKADFDDERSAVVGSEFVATSITSAGDGDDLPSWGEAILKANPHVRFFNGQRGYLRCTVTPERLTTDFRVLEYVKQPGSPVSTRASFVVEFGRAGSSRHEPAGPGRVYALRLLSESPASASASNPSVPGSGTASTFMLSRAQ